MAATASSLVGLISSAAASKSLTPSSTASLPATTTSASRTASQGILQGSNPSVYNKSDPIVLFIIQASLIIIVCHLLHWPLSKIRQPRVIAEVIGGIILGPSVMGHIPGFTDAIFPTASIPNLNLVANLGLVLYLFLIGVEVDVRFLVTNWRVATSVAVAGMAVPFALGCALSVGLYNEFSGEEGTVPVRFSTYMLFIGVAIAITAFPVLCRILTELKLLETDVGVIVLSAGVANDVVGWTLLALCVALVNAANGLTALWIFLICIGFLLFLSYGVGPALGWVLRRTGSIKNGPTQGAISLILLIALASAFFTDIIGVHPIFGGFMVGLVVIPRENAFGIRVIEKLEDLVGALFLPLYFTLSGLNTNLGLLDNGITWGYVFAVTLVALSTKFFGASLAARLSGLVWRESFTVGTLMSCKGLVELIVLNIGLQAKILSQRTFTIFVVMALVTTFITTPVTSYLYPPWYQKKIAAWKRGEIDWETGASLLHDTPNSGSGDGVQPAKPVSEVHRLLVHLRLDNLPTMLGLVLLFGGSSTPESKEGRARAAAGAGKEATSQVVPSAPGSAETAAPRVVRAHGIRLLQLTDRDSSVMTVAQVDEYSRHDPVVNTFRTVGQLHNMSVSGEVAIVPESRFAEALVAKSSKMASDLLLVPWAETGSINDSQLSWPTSAKDKLASSFMSFTKSVIESRELNVAVFITQDDAKRNADNQAERAGSNRAYSFTCAQDDFPADTPANKPHHLLLPYFEGADDRLALSLVLQLSANASVTSTVVFIPTSPGGRPDDYFESASASISPETAPRVRFQTAPTSDTIEEALEIISEGTRTEPRGDLRNTILVLGRSSGKDLSEGKRAKDVVEDVKETLGIMAGHCLADEMQVSLLVVQAKTS